MVWSETAVDIDLDKTPALVDRLGRLADEAEVPFVTGAPRSEGGRHTNSVVLFTPGRGIAESYAKQRLVPFAEYDPALAAPLARLLGPVVALGGAVGLLYALTRQLPAIKSVTRSDGQQGKAIVLASPTEARASWARYSGELRGAMLEVKARRQAR